MKTEIFTLCDFAAEYAGKFTITGAFDSCYVKQAPAVIPQCSLAIRLRAEKRDAGKHVLKIAIADASGKTLCTLTETPFEIQVPEPSPSISINLSTVISGLNISSIGVYSIELHIDGRLAGALPLHVYQVLPAKA